jgi:hypothetical protein
MSTVSDKVKTGPMRMAKESQRRLDSWKEIAMFFRREVRTVQRWERFEGLPVRRLFHRQASSVYAFASELNSWLETRSLTSANSKVVKIAPSLHGLFRGMPSCETARENVHPGGTRR